MNERIKELFEQALEEFKAENKYATIVVPNPLQEKLAELVILKCIDIVENLSPGYKDYRDQIEDAFRRDCVEEIKHHFGVEE
jgi:hypothetical protein